MIACPDCGLLEELPPLVSGTNAACALCGTDLERTSGRSITAGLCCALGTLILLIPGNLLPLLSVGIFGMHNQNPSPAVSPCYGIATGFCSRS